MVRVVGENEPNPVDAWSIIDRRYIVAGVILALLYGAAIGRWIQYSRERFNVAAPMIVLDTIVSGRDVYYEYEDFVSTLDRPDCEEILVTDVDARPLLPGQAHVFLQLEVDGELMYAWFEVLAQDSGRHTVMHHGSSAGTIADHSW